MEIGGRDTQCALPTPIVGITSAGAAVPIEASSDGSLNVASTPLQYTGVPSTAATASTSKTVFTLAAGERGFIQNLDTNALFVRLAAACTTSTFSFVLQAGNVSLDGKGGIAEDIDTIGAISVAPATGTGLYMAWKQAQ